MADVRQQAEIAETVGEDILDPRVFAGAAETVDAQIHFTGGFARLRAAGDDVDHTGNGLGAEQQALATFEHFDAFDGVGRQGVQIEAAVQAIVQAYAVEQDQRVVIAPAEQRIGAVIERTVFGAT